jgi:RNA polymerase sigma-70 factor (ECF subfamily)
MCAGESNTLQLLEGWHRGDTQSFGTLLERHLPWIRERIRQRLGPVLRKKGETGDYVHDAVLEFLQYAPRFVVRSEAQFRALLLRIAENTLRNRYRWFMAARRKIAIERPIPSTTILSLDPAGATRTTPSQSAERREREAWVRLAMELLDDEDQQVLVLRQWENRSFVEIGEELGMTAAGARVRHLRALRRLAAKTGELRTAGLSSLVEEGAA